jgi:hypothetical protein
MAGLVMFERRFSKANPTDEIVAIDEGDIVDVAPCAND